MDNKLYKVSNFIGRSGKAVPNQFKIMTEDGLYFQSYDSVIVWRKNNGSVVLDEKYWNYSQTTGKYRNDFLGETKGETEKKIKSGVYQLANLN